MKDKIYRKTSLTLQREILQKKLGGGEFGIVLLCRLQKETGNPESIEVAVKMPRDKYDVKHYKALVDEMRIMIAVGIHPNILCFIGAVVQHISK